MALAGNTSLRPRSFSSACAPAPWLCLRVLAFLPLATFALPAADRPLNAFGRGAGRGVLSLEGRAELAKRTGCEDRDDQPAQAALVFSHQHRPPSFRPAPAASPRPAAASPAFIPGPLTPMLPP